MIRLMHLIKSLSSACLLSSSVSIFPLKTQQNKAKENDSSGEMSVRKRVNYERKFFCGREKGAGQGRLSLQQWAAVCSPSRISETRERSLFLHLLPPHLTVSSLLPLSLCLPFLHLPCGEGWGGGGSRREYFPQPSSVAPDPQAVISGGSGWGGAARSFLWPEGSSH